MHVGARCDVRLLRRNEGDGSRAERNRFFPDEKHPAPIETETEFRAGVRCPVLKERNPLGIEKRGYRERLRQRHGIDNRITKSLFLHSEGSFPVGIHSYRTVY